MENAPDGHFLYGFVWVPIGMTPLGGWRLAYVGKCGQHV